MRNQKKKTISNGKLNRNLVKHFLNDIYIYNIYLNCQF